MKFTKEEINLCKRIAELWRKPIECGDWIAEQSCGDLSGQKDYRIRIMITDEEDHITIWDNTNRQRLAIYKSQIIPLWQIQDALDWLSEKVGTIELWRTGRTLKWICRWENEKWKAGKTSLEALLKAVLEVLRKEGEK